MAPVGLGSPAEASDGLLLFGVLSLGAVRMGESNARFSFSSSASSELLHSL